MDAMGMMLVIGVVIGMGFAAKDQSITGTLATAAGGIIGIGSLIVVQRLDTPGLLFGFFAWLGIAIGMAVGLMALFTIGVYVWGILRIAKDVAGRSWGWAGRRVRGVF